MPRRSRPGSWFILYPRVVPGGSMFRPLALALLACLLHSRPLLAQARPASQANPALEEFKTLAGEWEGKDSHGGNIHVSYEVMSSGVVMERLQPEGGPGMMTMYSLD